MGCLDVARHDNWLRYNVIPAMEFALSRECGRKPRELMTPSKHEGVFYGQLYFGNARRRAWYWSAILDLGIRC
jgi:hypothetical protein